MKLHIIVDFRKCKTKGFTSKGQARKYVVQKFKDRPSGEAVWKAIEGEYLFDVEGLLYVTVDVEQPEKILTLIDGCSKADPDLLDHIECLRVQ